MKDIIHNIELLNHNHISNWFAVSTTDKSWREIVELRLIRYFVKNRFEAQTDIHADYKKHVKTKSLEFRIMQCPITQKNYGIRTEFLEDVKAIKITIT